MSFLTQPRLSEKVNSTGNGLEQVGLWHICREQPFPRLNGVRVMGTSRAQADSRNPRSPHSSVLHYRHDILSPCLNFPKMMNCNLESQPNKHFLPFCCFMSGCFDHSNTEEAGHCLSQASGKGHVDTTVNMGGFKKKLNKIIYSLIYCCSETELLVCPDYPASLHQK